MITNEFGTRRGYDDRYDHLDGWARGRTHDPRRGDWMREMPWGQHPASNPLWSGSPAWGVPSWGHPAWGGDPSLAREGSWGGEPLWAREGWWGRDPSRLQDIGYEPMVKVVEIVADSPHSWEDATRRAIAEASQSVRGIRSIYIKDMQAVVEEDRVVGFRVNAKIAYSVEGRRR